MLSSFLIAHPHCQLLHHHTSRQLFSFVRSPFTVATVVFGTLLLRRPHVFQSPGCGVSCNRSRGPKDTPVHDTQLLLLPPNLLDLTDLFLNFAGYLFTDAFSFQLWIIA
jgi:hypothetical protein